VSCKSEFTVSFVEWCLTYRFLNSESNLPGADVRLHSQTYIPPSKTCLYLVLSGKRKPNDCLHSGRPSSFRILGWVRDFSLLRSVQTGSGSLPVTSSVGARHCFTLAWAWQWPAHSAGAWQVFNCSSYWTKHAATSPGILLVQTDDERPWWSKKRNITDNANDDRQILTLHT
jgi:hypothetical protein